MSVMYVSVIEIDNRHKHQQLRYMTLLDFKIQPPVVNPGLNLKYTDLSALPTLQLPLVADAR